MEHVLYVSSIASTIARTLNVNQDLVNAIALGHDLGHAPFGHSGERSLDECIMRVSKGEGNRFKHELNSLRVVDRLAKRMTSDTTASDRGLNLTFEVRDGIVSHCGETKNEYRLSPDRSKTPMDIEGLKTLPAQPATLEGCIVKIVDKIAYVGRDVEDAIRVGVISMKDIPQEIRSELGETNGSIINTLVTNLVENSYGKDIISLSTEKGEALSELISENNRLIYKSDKIVRYERGVNNTMEGLFDNLFSLEGDFEILDQSELKVHRAFYDFIVENNLEEEEIGQRTVDFISGMTDGYAIKSYDEIYAL
jgi:dGTPase